MHLISIPLLPTQLTTEIRRLFQPKQKLAAATAQCFFMRPTLKYLFWGGTWFWIIFQNKLHFSQNVNDNIS